MLNRFLIACVLAVALPASAHAQDHAGMVYTLDATRAGGQVLTVTITLPDAPRGGVELAMPVWRPGRYEVLDFAGAIRWIRAENARGNEIPISKTGKSEWVVDNPARGDVRVEYELFANELDRRTRHADDSHAFVSGESVFLYAPHRRDQPCEVRVEAPAGWSISTGLERVRETTLRAPDYDILVDSPIEIGRHQTVSFSVSGKPHEIAVWGRTEGVDLDKLASDFARIVETQGALFGELPYERYVYILHVAPGLGGGTEHVNSTVLQTSPERLRDDAYEGFLGLVSHEMFHTWNVKQFRPKGIKPYDYQHETYTTLLWVAEGSTSYYDDLTLVRADLIDVDEYLNRVSETIDAYFRTPGQLVQPLSESSYDAWIKFNKRHADSHNSTVSFYSKGSLVSLLLDMAIRVESADQRSYDDVMRTLYAAFPLAGDGYTPEDFLDACERAAGADLGAFFADNVTGVAELRFSDLLGHVGLELVFEPRDRDTDDDERPEPVAEGEPVPLRGDLGARTRKGGAGLIVRDVLVGTPAAEAGLVAGDEIVALDGVRATIAALEALLDDHEPGDQVDVTVFRRDTLLTRRFALAGEPDGKWTIRRVTEPDEFQKRAYEAWLGHAWPDDEGEN